MDAKSQQLEEIISRRVKEYVDANFKDRALVDIETTQTILNRLYSWSKLFAFFVGIPVALLLISLSIAGIQKYSDFTKLISSVESQVKPRIESAKASADSAQQEAAYARDQSLQAKKTIETVIPQVRAQLGSATQLSNSVRDLSERVSTLESQTSHQIQASSEHVNSSVAEIDRKIDAANKDIAAQEQKLASTNELVKSLFSKGTTEYFDTKNNSNRIVTIPLKKGALVYMLLGAAPISQTLEVKWRVFSQPRGSYFPIANNVVMFIWGDPADSLKEYPLEVTYIPDPTVKSEPFKSLSLKEGHLYADGNQLQEVPAPQN
ncbi:MAG TPA: hypothetical protein VGS15_11105 [Candidatus Acidoferrales bacterium]|nr:hypothetical protein [Candidatus Acidoferrales bacterium]